ncbi:MAG: polysaccharide biosynthesis tyrosine autokinase [Sphingomonadaceae bacterium]
MEFWNLYRMIRKRLWMVLFLVVVTVSSTIVTVMTRPPSYKATATVRVAVTSPSVADVGRLDWYTAGILFSTIQETILSRSILQEVIDQNMLGVTPDEFRKAVGATRVGNSNLLKIEVKSTDPEFSKRLANDIASTFIRYNQNLLDTQNASSIAFYEEQVKQAEANYTKAKEDFRNSLNQPNSRAAENQFIAAQAAYQAALDKLDAARLLNRFPDLRPSSVSIAEPAVTPTEPEGRQVARYTLIALLVSLILGVFIAMGIEYLDMSIKSPHEVTTELGLAVIGVIPHFRRGVSGFVNVLANLDLPLLSRLLRSRIQRAESSIMSAEKLPLGPAEAFRKARLNLMASHRSRRLLHGEAASTVLITSSRPRDGKTTMVAQLGIALAKAGQAVLLLDGDVRKPQLHRHFGLDPNEPGLAQLLLGEVAVGECVRPTGYTGLSVILSGAASEEHAELLDSDRFSELMACLAAEFDFVLVDSPALGLYTDGAALASRVGRALLVVDATRPSSENEMRSIALLTSAGAVVEGVIVNKINPEYVDPAKLHALPRHVVELAHLRNGGGHGSANGRSNGAAGHDPAGSRAN